MIGVNAKIFAQSRNVFAITLDFFHIVNINSQINFFRLKRLSKCIQQSKKSRNVAGIMNKYDIMRIYSERFLLMLYKQKFASLIDKSSRAQNFYLLLALVSMQIAQSSSPSYSNYDEDVSLLNERLLLKVYDIVKKKSHFLFKT